jgi:hypothetical protein
LSAHLDFAVAEREATAHDRGGMVLNIVAIYMRDCRLANGDTSVLQLFFR